MKKLSWAVLPLVIGCGLGCGDIGSARLDVSFEDGTIESQTRALMLVVREVRMPNVNGCDSLWSNQPSSLAESRSVVVYPNRNDVLAAPVKLSMYPNLTLLVYAYPTTEVANSRPLAGGCVQSQIEGEATQTLDVVLKKAP
ncbi:MAG: hypothetical protein IPG45_05420 [Deltaproteobacteria bacterium]|jgi:hypothetical protein|nr:hypothetical protein [Deltaproteobacteria bacterium]